LCCATAQFHKRKKKGTVATVAFFVALQHNVAKKDEEEGDGVAVPFLLRCVATQLHKRKKK
jgi:hypothetical protein